MQMKVCTVLSGSHCPKESFQSKKRLEISVVTAVSEFNFGSLFTLKHVHQNASLPSMQISGVRDERRLKQKRISVVHCPASFSATVLAYAEMGHGGTVGRCVQRVVTHCPVGTLVHESPAERGYPQAHKVCWSNLLTSPLISKI
ncbi:hypothetical protein TNCV_2813701 [Trichonephila clavipes]|nr:hypothetical protein TNCV_2813701 [Trichonephila clavipes]